MKPHSSPHPTTHLCVLTKLGVTTLTTFCALNWLALPAFGQRTWTGANSQYWSDPNNWNPPGVPQYGENLFFNGNDSNTSMINDLTGVTVSDMTFSGHDHQLSGNPITLSFGLDNFLYYNADGSYTTTINCPLIFPYGGQIRSGAGAGTLFEATQDLYLNGQLTLNGPLDLESLAQDTAAGGNSHIHIASVISGTNDVSAFAAAGSGHVSEITFDGEGNTFTGTLYLDGPGQFVFNKTSGAVALNRLEVGLDAYDYSPESVSVNLAQPSQLGSDASIVVTGGSQLHLSGNNMTVGSIIMTNSPTDTNASVLDTGSTVLGLIGHIASWNDSASVVPIIQGNLNLTGPLSFTTVGSVYAGLDIQATLEGIGGGVAKDGNSALILEGNNTFDGTTLVNEGVLDVRNNGALGSTNGPTLLAGNGSLTLRNVTVAGETLLVGGLQQVDVDTAGSLLNTVGNCTWAGPIELDTNLVILADNTTLSGAISGTGGLDFRNGTAIIGGSAANTFTGTTLVRCPLLEFNKPAGTPVCAGPLVVGGGSGGPYEARWLQSEQDLYGNVTLYANGLVNINNNGEGFDTVTFNGGTIETGTGEFAIYQPLIVNANSATAVINGYLDLPSFSDRDFIVADGPADPDLLVNAEIYGSPYYFVKQGPGTVRLTSVNTFTAGTLLDAGILDVNNVSALGNAGYVCNISSGATLRISIGGTIPNNFAASGAGVGGTNGAFQIVAGNVVTLPGSIQLNGATTLNIGALVPSDGLTLSGQISGTGPLTKTGPGYLYFIGAANNTYSGDTVITAGETVLGRNPNVVSVPGNLVIGPASASTPAQVLINQLGGFVGYPGVTVNANSLFNLNNDSETLSQLTLNGGGYVTTGSGVLDFTSGATVSVGSSHVSCSIQGNIGMPPNASDVNFNVSRYELGPPYDGRPELDVPANIFITGPESTSFRRTGINKTGLGQMRLSGNNSFAGSASVNAGTLIAASANALGTTDGETAVNSDATLALDGGVTISGESLYLTGAGTSFIELDSRTGGNTWTGPIHLTGDTLINVDSLLTVQGVVSGSGNLIKSGTSTLAFTGSANNTYVGDTYINNGLCYLEMPSGVTAIPRNVIVGDPVGGTGAILRQYSSFSIIGSVTVNANSVWNLNGNNEGFSSISPAPVTLNDGGNVDTRNFKFPTSVGNLYLPVGGDVVVNPGTNTTSHIYGAVGLDPGIHHFTVGKGSTTPGIVELSVAATVSQTSTAAAIEKDGPGTLQLTGANTYTGTNVAAGGILQVDGAQPSSAVQVTSGTLGGIGTVGAIYMNGSSGVVSPGDSPGILNCANFNPASGSGSLRIELNGTTPGSGYDQLNVTGTVNLTGVSLNASLGFASSTNDQFTIINNDGSDAVVGTFTGLAQNGKLYVGSQLFQVTYTGGSGNDVVLKRLITPPPPVLTIERLSTNSVALFWATNDPPFSLQIATNLPGTNWTAALPFPAVIGTNNVVTNSADNVERFYRLTAP